MYEVLQGTWHPLDGLWTTRILRTGIHLTEETGYFLPHYVQRRHHPFLRVPESGTGREKSSGAPLTANFEVSSHTKFN